MRSIARAAWAAALLNCALPQAFADDANHWLKDPYTQCRMFDANARPGDHVGWLGECDGGLASGEGTAIFMNGDKQFESFTGSFARGVALDGPVTVTWGEGWRYEGNQSGGQFSGAGVLINPLKDRFSGNWIGGKMNGHGTLVRSDGELYEGLWKDDLPDGEGTLTRADGSIVKGVFHDGKLDGAALETPQILKKGELKKAPEVHAFDSISGKTLTSVDGSHIALTLIEGGIERQITDMGAQPKKTTFTFMNDRLGTVVEDGGVAAGANVTGFFRLTDTGVEVRYADGRGEMLTATPDGGVLMQRSAAGGQTSCRSWYPDGHTFSETDKKQALAEYASRLGLGPAPTASCDAPGPVATLRPSDSKAREHVVKIKPVSLTAPAHISAPTRIEALLPVTVKDSVVHTIDADTTTPPVQMTRLAEPQAVLPSGERDASACLKVESDGSHWGFRNACGYSVQFSYCMRHGSEALAACVGEGGGPHAVSGSVAANGLATLTTDTSFSEKDGEHDFRWIACDGGAGEVVAHLEHADPPSGRCERAAVAANRH